MGIMGAISAAAKEKGDGLAAHPLQARPHLLANEECPHYSSGTSSRATMLMILISGLMAGPAVSL
jgi:hypothetical protein